jgi:hypothetical protein
MQATKQNPFALSVAEAVPVANPDNAPAAHGTVTSAGQWAFNNMRHSAKKIRSRGMACAM